MRSFSCRQVVLGVAALAAGGLGISIVAGGPPHPAAAAAGLDPRPFGDEFPDLDSWATGDWRQAAKGAARSISTCPAAT
jgi:hypothetical protein